MAETKNSIHWETGLVHQVSILEELNVKIAALSDFDFAEKVAAVTSAEANTYTVCEQVYRMNNALLLLAAGWCKSIVLVLLEEHREGAAVNMIERGMNYGL